MNLTFGKKESIALQLTISGAESLFSMLRNGIRETTADSLCVGTFYFQSDTLWVSSRQRLSEQLLKAVEAKVQFELKKNKQVLAPGELQIRLNDKIKEKNKLKSKEVSFFQEKIFPISVENNKIGLVYLGSLSAEIDLNDKRFTNLFKKDFFKILNSLSEANQKEKNKFEALSTSVIDGIILCDSDMKIRFINNAALRILEISSHKKCLGEPLSFLKASYLTEFLEEALSNGLHEINKVINSPDKRTKLIGIHTELIKTKSNGKVGWMIALRDVTMNWQNDQMRSALSIAGHEIKTPLSSMNGAIELMIDRDLGDLNSKQEQCLSVIKDDITRLNRLLTDILDLSRFEEGVKFIDRRKEIALNFLSNKVIYSFQAFAKTKNIKIINKVAKSIPTFRGDRDRLQQVMANLIENSIKYSLPDGVVEVAANLQNSILNFSIKDSGVGIPESEKEAVFERFKQLDNYPDEGERGYGLGLSIAKQIVEGAGGKIWLESEVDVGTTFYFTIPV